jgi:hypothetical protein
MAEPAKKKRKADEKTTEEEEDEPLEPPALEDFGLVWERQMYKRHAEQTIRIAEECINKVIQHVEQGSMPQEAILELVVAKRPEPVCPWKGDVDEIARCLDVWCRAHNLWCGVSNPSRREVCIRPPPRDEGWDIDKQGPPLEWKAKTGFEWPECKIVRAWLEERLTKERQEMAKK